MALVGVSSGAVQFMAYEQMKNFAFARKQRRMLANGQQWRQGEEKLVRLIYYNCGPHLTLSEPPLITFS